MSNLFDPGPVDPGHLEADALAGLSPDARRTIRNNGLLAGGTHPVTLRRLATGSQPGAGHTCGDCNHHVINERGHRYHKCDLRLTFGAATDVRVGWPACDLWTPERADDDS